MAGAPWVWPPIVGGGLGSASLSGPAVLWDGRVYPKSVPLPSVSASDEFRDAAAFATRWTTWDHAGWQTRTIDPVTGSLIITGTANANNRAGGVMQALSANDEMQFIARCAIDCDPAGDATHGINVGLFFAADGSSAASALRTIQVIASAPAANELQLRYERPWVNYTTPSGGTDQGWTGNDIWFRMRILVGPGALTTWWNDWSTDGWNWQTLNGVNARTVGYAAKNWGLFMDANNSKPCRVRFQHCRVWRGAGALGFNYALNGGPL